MRQGPHVKRSRGRGHGQGNGGGMNGGGGQGGGGGQRKPVPLRHQTFDSNGPDVRVRGNAYQVFEKYLALARDATSAGDRVAAENYYQHAEHYYRIINANNDGQPYAAPAPRDAYDVDPMDGAPGTEPQPQVGGHTSNGNGATLHASADHDGGGSESGDVVEPENPNA